ncbi:MAG: gluconate 5-dehydrogenase [Planctomycetaceae bacterium]|nr:gluconate 5-dehydrogenase [Planctomycetaceae bacterium]
MSASAEYLQNLFGLTGKTAVVIGGTGVLGGAISEALAGAGAHTIVVGRTLKEDEDGKSILDRIAAQGGSAEFFQADSTQADDLNKLLDHLKSNDRCCDVLVNGPGKNAATPFVEISSEEWDDIFNVNLSSIRLACQILGAYMVQKEHGSIINITSVSSELPLSRVFTYSATKAALLNLTRNLAREWAPKGVRVNALSPGFFPAEQNRKVLTKERVASIMEHSPIDRFGSPEELAGAVLLMAAPKASSFLVGANIIVDGGFTAMTI